MACKTDFAKRGANPTPEEIRRLCQLIRESRQDDGLRSRLKLQKYAARTPEPDPWEIPFIRLADVKP